MVDHEVPVLDDLPELEELVADKWNKFAFGQHMQKAVLPYCVIVVAITVAIVNRIEDLKEHTHVLYAGPVLEYDRRDQVQIAVEVIVYLLGVPFLLNNAWATSRLGLIDSLLIRLGKGTGRKGINRRLDLNLDGEISYGEFTMYVFRNLNSVFSTAIACLLAAAAAIRLSSHPHWLRVSAECYEEETVSSWRLSQELDLLSVAALCAWLNVLFTLVPFKAPGLLLIALFRMLSRDVVKWLFLYLIILCAFSLSGLAMLYDFEDDTDTSSRTSHAHARLRKTSGTGGTEEFNGAASLVTWPDMLKFFIWSSVGEVNPGSVLMNARNPEAALTLYLCFVVLSTLVLINLLISLMSNTFATGTAHGRQIWWFEFATLVLRYEARLSDKAKQKYRCGTFIQQSRSMRGKHDVVWYDIKYKNAKESQYVRKWRKQIIKNETHKEFINGKFSELQEKFSEKFHQIENLLKNKIILSATPPLPPLKEEEARKRREVAATEMASAPPEGIPIATDRQREAARAGRRRRTHARRTCATETEPSAELDADIVDRATPQIFELAKS